jgi:Domain of unknown function (DUF4112)
MRSLPVSNEHLDYIAALLDDMWQIPGTKIRFGLDAVIGWVPGVGDAMAGAASCVIIFAAWKRGARPVTLARMAANVGLESILGAVPIVGDAFHIFWKANRRNYRLFVREKQEPGRNTKFDWIYLFIIIIAAGAVLAVPITLLVWGAKRAGWL